MENERDVLRRSQHRTPYFRSLIDEISDPHALATIALKYLQGSLLDASVERTLNREEVKHVSHCILEAVSILQDDGMVHDGIEQSIITS